jgi:hypothetical protein
MFAVCLLARYSKSRQQAACRGVAHLLSVEMGLTYIVDQSKIGQTLEQIMDLYGMSDADWASGLRTRRFTSGWLVFALGGVIAWGSKLMATIAASSMESEYMSAYFLGQQLLSRNWICSLEADTFLHGCCIRFVCAEESCLAYSFQAYRCEDIMAHDELPQVFHVHSCED